MEFDNKQFESGVQDSVKSLDKLKKGLDLDGATASLTNLEKAGRSFSLAGISSSVDTIASRFTTLGIVGVTALVNITNSAVNAGKSIMSALTIDPIKMGFDEYETKMGSIQTILTNTASKGTTLDDVNKALDELNTYSDQTIYNFEEMTRNIGTFTAAGVDLKTSTMAIKGIANLAAGSGSSAMQASTAMYQLSQALAAGKVSLMDWNSVVNAGMGGELFQKALEKTAKELGKGRNMAVSFRDSLQDGWITTDVLTKTLQKFADDPSLVKAATQVKTFTQLFDTMKESVQSGWAKTWETIVGGKDESSAMLTNINNVFGEMIGKSADARNAMLSFWKANGGRDAMISSVANAFKALMSVLTPIGDAFRSIFPATTGVQLVAITKGINDFAAGLKIGNAAAYNLKSTFQGVFAVLDIIKQALTAAGMGVLGLINALVPAGNGILAFTGSLGQFLVHIDDVVKKTNFFGNILTNVGGIIKVAADGIGNALSTIVKWLSGIGSISVDGISYFVDQVTTRFSPLSALGGFLGGVMSIIGAIMSKLAPIFVNLASIVGSAMDKLRDSIVSVINGGGNSSLADMLNTGLLAAILIGLKKFIKELPSLTDMADGVLKNITGMLDGVKGSLEAYQKNLQAGTLLKIASAIGILATSLLVLSTIDSKKLTSALAAITVMFIELFASMAAFEKLSGGGMMTMAKISVGMLGLSTAILILSGAMTKLAKLDWNGITKGLVGIGVIMAELVIFMKMSNFSKMGVSTGLGIIALAAGINMLATAVYAFSELKPEALAQGLLAVGAILVELIAFTKLVGNPKGLITTAIGIGILGSAMVIFAGAIGLMGNMPLDTIGKGLMTMAGALIIVAGALKIMPNNGILIGIGLLGISTALVILSGALKVMGGMSWEAIGKGLVLLAGSLTILAVAMSFMQTALPGAAALLVISAALAILAPTLIMLGSVSLTTIGTGLLALAGAFVVIGVSGLVLTPLIPVLLGLAAAVTLFGIGCLAVGAGVLAFSMGLTALAAASTAGAAALTLMITSIVSLIPFVVKTLAEGLVQFIQVIGKSAPVIAQALISVVKAILDGIVAIIPQVLNSFLTLLESLLRLIAEHVPKLIKAGADIIVGFIKGITEQVPRVVDAVVNLIVTLLNNIAQQIPKLITAGVNVIVAFLDGISSQLPRVIQAGFNLIISFIEGLATALENNKGRLIAAIQNLMAAMISAGVSAVTSSVSRMYQAGVNLVQGFINGIRSMISNAASSAGSLASSVVASAKSVLGIHSPSRVFRDEVGAMIASGMAEGIRKHANEAKKASSDMAKDAVEVAKDWIESRKYYNELSLEDELYIWKELQKQYQNGTEEKMKIDREAYRVERELLKANYDAAVKYIDDKKYYNQMSLEEELAAWKKIQQEHIEGIDDKEKADREVYRVTQELNKKAYDDAVELIDDRKYYNELSLKEELAIWQDVQSKYLAGTEERKKADREVYRVTQEINKANKDYTQKKAQIEQQANEKRKDLWDDYYTKTKDINDKLIQDIASVNKEYEDAVDTRANSLYSSYGLFDKIDSKQYVNGDKLIQNLQDQNVAFEDWQRNINELSAKGIDSELVKELSDMGPKSASQIEALNALSSDKLDQYVSLWKTKHEDAKIQATNELDSMRQDTIAKIQELNKNAKIELNDYKKTWSEQMDAVNSDTKEQLDELEEEWSSKIGTITTNAETEIKNMSTNIQASVSDMRVKTETEVTTLAQNIKTIIGQTDWYSVGTNMMDGMIKGIKDRAGALAQQAAEAALSALTAAKTALGIHSPSKEFAKLGMYACEGLGVGLDKYSSVVSTKASNIGTTAIESLKNTISSVSSLFGDNVDMNPTIRPVLDLDNVMSGVNSMNTLFDKTQGITVSTANNRASLISRGMQSNREIQNGVETKVASVSTSQQSPKQPIALQLMLQNGRAIAEYIIDDVDSLMGSKNKITGRMVGTW
jgi:tape measure domain-containing protein